eukprot:Awhi_evm1s8790
MEKGASRSVLVDVESEKRKIPLAVNNLKRKHKIIAVTSAIAFFVLVLIIAITVGVVVGGQNGDDEEEYTNNPIVGSNSSLIQPATSSGVEDDKPSTFAYTFSAGFSRNAFVEFSKEVSPYDVLEDAPFDNTVEESDKHDEKHLTVVYDEDLQKEVLHLVMHRDKDGDGASSSKSDRQRTEFKGSQKSDKDILGYEDDTLIYAWWFKLNEDASPTNKFWHIFQLKWYGASDGTPMTTFGLKTFSGEPKFYYTDYGDRFILGDLKKFTGKWIQAFVKVKYGDKDRGTLFMDFKDIDGNRLIDKPVEKSGIDRWGAGDFVRPKWGIYRSLIGEGSLNKEDFIQFSDISIYKEK